jgi:uncharacterized membrane protein YGL010W
MVDIRKAKPVLLPRVPDEMTPVLLAAHAINFVLSIIVVQASLAFEDAEKAMAFYGVYHREPWNQVIHFFGVPLIIWTLFVCQAHLPLTQAVTIDFLPFIPSHYISWATLWFLYYAGFYFTIDATGALMYAPVLFIMYATAIRWAHSDQKEWQRQNAPEWSPPWTGTGKALRWAAALHVLAWYMQLHPGHQVIEGAKPALMQSLGGALTSAPLFAFYEGVWFAGFRQDFHQKVFEQVAVYTKELCEQGVVMRACASA